MIVPPGAERPTRRLSGAGVSGELVPPPVSGSFRSSAAFSSDVNAPPLGLSSEGGSGAAGPASWAGGTSSAAIVPVSQDRSPSSWSSSVSGPGFPIGSPASSAMIRPPSSQGGNGSSGGGSIPSVESMAADQIFRTERYDFTAPETLGENAVRDQRLQRAVVMTIGASGIDSESREKFFRTPRILAQFDHPSIPKVHDLGERHQRPYYTLDRLEGRSLVTILEDEEAREGLGLPSLVRAMLQVAEAITHAHEVGLLHTRLEADAVSLGDFGQVWVSRWENALARPSAKGKIQSIAMGGRGAPGQEGAIAPELRRGLSPSRRTDVWGLGQLLHQILTGEQTEDGEDCLDEGQWEEGLPRELIAITEKALSERPEDRYEGADRFQEELRRFLDGRSVEALAESPLQTVARLTRRHPLPTAIISGALGMVVLAASLATAGVIQARRDERSALIAERRARARAAEGREQAEVAHLAAREAIRKATGRLELESLLARAQVQSKPGRKSDAEVVKTFALAGERAEGLSEDAQRRFYALRGGWRLRGRLRPDPLGAVDDFREAAKRAPRDGRTQLDLFIAMRRVPNAEERYARQFDRLLSETAPKLPSPYRDLLALERSVQAGEAEILKGRLAVSWPEKKLFVKNAQSICAPLEKILMKLRADNIQIDYANELLGRSMLVRAGIGHVSQGGGYGVMQRAVQYDEAVAMLDPAAVERRASVLLQWNEKYALHQTWRWVNSWQFQRIFADLHLVTRPEALVSVMELLQKLENYAGSLALAEPIFAFEGGYKRARSQGAKRLWAKAKIMHARALLRTSSETSALKLPEASDEIPRDLRASYHLLRAQAFFIKKDPRSAFDEINQGMGFLRFDQTGLAFKDLFFLFVDPRSAHPSLMQLLGQQIPRTAGKDNRIVRQFLAARIFLGARLGADVQRDFQRYQRGGVQLSQLEGKVALLGMARFLAERQPQNPLSHSWALDVWRSINPHTHDEWLCYEAQEIIVKRLKKLGKSRAAKGFAALEAVDELWVRRRWVPRELHVWHHPSGRLVSSKYPESKPEDRP